MVLLRPPLAVPDRGLTRDGDGAASRVAGCGEEGGDAPREGGRGALTSCWPAPPPTGSGWSVVLLWAVVPYRQTGLDSMGKAVLNQLTMTPLLTLVRLAPLPRSTLRPPPSPPPRRRPATPVPHHRVPPPRDSGLRRCVGSHAQEDAGAGAGHARGVGPRSPSRLPTATSVRRDSSPPCQPLPWPASDPLPDMPSSHRAEASAGGLLADGGLCQPAPCAKQLPLPRRPCDGRAASPTHCPVPTRSDAHDWHDQAPSGPSSPPT